jgi:TPR repeat protein
MNKINFLNFCLIGILTLFLGCKKNDSKDVSQMTVTELQEAANQGNDQAMVRLGLMYDVGRGLTQDTNERL